MKSRKSAKEINTKGSNPKQPPGMVLKPVVNNGEYLPNINWWDRISEPSTVLISIGPTLNNGSEWIP